MGVVSITARKSAAAAGGGGVATPERARLAEAIARRDQAAAELAAAERAHTAAKEKGWRMQAEHEAASVAVNEARENAVAAEVARALGKSSAPAVTLSEARRQLADAEDAVRVQRDVTEALRQRVEVLEGEASMAKFYATQAAKAVLATAPGLQRAVVTAERLEREYLSAALAVQWILNSGFLGDLRNPMIPGPASPAQGIRDHMGVPPVNWLPHIHDSTIPGAGPWKQALAALQIDAYAQLPE